MHWTLSNYALVCLVIPFIWFLRLQRLVYMDTLIITDIIEHFTLCCLLLLLIANSDRILDLTISHGVITKDLILVLVFCLNSITLLVVIEVLTSTSGLA